MGARTIHPFPARMAPDIAINHLDSNTACPLDVLDPMCGSGTVLAAASAAGHRVRGFDMDPLAVLMSTVATRPLDTGTLAKVALLATQRAMNSNKSASPWDDVETPRFAEYWFGEIQRRQLSRMVVAIGEVEDVAVRDALRVALSRTIITKTPKASLAADTSHSRPHRVLSSSTYNVYDGFQRSVTSLIRLLDKREIGGLVDVKRGDARDLALADRSIDLTITSPPYLNAIDYMRGHKMSLIWLGYSIPELRAIRSNSIGAERAMDGEAHAQVRAMVHEVELAVPDPAALPLATITRYAHDLVRFANELIRVSRPGAEVVTVIGNSTLRGNYIENDRIVQSAYELAGFGFVARSERELPESRRYMPVTRAVNGSSMSKRMRTEIVLTMSSPS